MTRKTTPTKKKPTTKKKSSKIEANDNSLDFVTMTGPLTIVAAEGDKKLPTFKMVAYTGGVMNVGAFYDPIVVDLDGVQIQAQEIPVRLDHDRRQGVGHTESVSVENGKIVANGVISRDTSWAREVVASGKNGFPWQASIGADVQRTEYVEAGVSTEVNGKTVTGPAIIARQSVLKEISFVDLGADSGTSAKVAAKHKEEKPMKKTKNAITETEGQNLEAADGQEAQPATKIEASGDTNPTAQPKIEASDPVATMRAEAAAESTRISAIRKLCANGHAEIEAKAIGENWDATKTELEVLRASRPAAPSVLSGGTEMGPQVLEAAALMAGGVSGDEVVKSHGDKAVEASEKRFRRGIGLQQLLLEAAWAAGYTGRFFRENPREVLQAAFSTVSLPGILSNVANKFLLAGYEGVEDSWRRISAIRSVNDFKTATSYRLTGDMKFEKVGPDGELKHGTVGEESYTNQADTYGRMFAITRKDLINDDLGALVGVPGKIGRGAALEFNRIFWTAFMNNATFFASGNTNYQEGADTVLSIDGLTTAEVLFLNQTDADGYPIAIMPKVLLVPSALKVAAELLMSSLRVNETTTANKPKPADNPHAGKFEAVYSTYLSNATITGYSALAWYLLADPNDIPVIESAFLNGQQQPIVEQSDADFKTLGIQMRGYFDFGVSKQDYRGGVKSKGAA